VRARSEWEAFEAWSQGSPVPSRISGWLMTGGLEDALAAVGPGDTSGSETFARYLYQCKVGVQRWLATIEAPEDAFLLCEFVDDVTTVTSAEVCFAQVKTRDRGAWTAARVLAAGGGIDALVRSFNLANAAETVPPIRLELILEGPEGPLPDTRRFFADRPQRQPPSDLGCLTWVCARPMLMSSSRVSGLSGNTTLVRLSTPSRSGCSWGSCRATALTSRLSTTSFSSV
jgi:hypothetical protein